MKRTLIWLTLLLTGVGMNALAQTDESEEAAAATEEPVPEVQEVKYVTDKLRLSLYKQSNERSGTLKLLMSGDQLDVLELSGPYARVRTDAGLIGWVKNGFLVSEPTASYQLIEEQKKNQILAQQIEKYSDTDKLVQDYENTIGKINQDFDQVRGELDAANQQLEQLREENSDMSERIEAYQQNAVGLADVLKVAMQYWYYVLGGMIVLLLIGFMLGRELIEARVRRRFQGVKVW